MTLIRHLLHTRSIAATLGLLSLFISPAAQARAQALPATGRGRTTDSPSVTAPINTEDASSGETLHLLVGHSMVLRDLAPLRRIYVGDPAVLRSFTASPSEIVLTAKSSGVSSLVLWDTSGQSRLYTVAADIDCKALQNSLREAYPASTIAVDGIQGRLYLSGVVPTQEIADGAVKLAGSYAKDVVSSLRVEPLHGKQVQLKLRIVEVDRTRMEQYGINFAGIGKNPFSVSTQQNSAPVPVDGVFKYTDPLNVLLFSSALNIGATVKDLEQKQILQVLAEPTLTAISGQPARFLSGGEFPYPVVQGGGTVGGAAAISISFRPYGVKVDFTPTVNADGSIRLKVSPEVSALDFSNAVTISGYTIPALSTRRAETEVEIKSGQSFALSGLLDHRTTENLNKMPGIANLPILGKLFVSKSYTQSIVELVVLVTATVVDPLESPETVVEPTMAVPNMDAKFFDRQLSKDQKIQQKKQ